MHAGVYTAPCMEGTTEVHTKPMKEPSIEERKNGGHTILEEGNWRDHGIGCTQNCGRNGRMQGSAGVGKKLDQYNVKKQ